MNITLIVAVSVSWALTIWLANHHKKSSRARKNAVADAMKKIDRLAFENEQQKKRAQRNLKKINDLVTALPIDIQNIFEFPQIDEREKKENTIWIYWDSGVEAAPDIVLHSYRLWVEKNPDFDVVFLDDENLEALVGFNFVSAAKCFPFVSLAKAAFSDLLRVYLLYRFGGVWVDAATLCIQPISSWLPKDDRDLFCFKQPSDCPDRQLVSWFMASRQGHPVMKELLEQVLLFLGKKRDDIPDLNWSAVQTAIDDQRTDLVSREGTGFQFLAHCEDQNLLPYFWMFYLWNEVLKNNPDEKKALDNKPNQYCQPTAEWDEFLSAKVAKQTHKDFRNSEREKRALYLIENSVPKTKLSFLHIPKTAGTSIENSALKRGIFWGRFDRTFKRDESVTYVPPWHTPQRTMYRAFCVVRNPLDRVISQFRHENEVEDFDEARLNAWVATSIEQLRANPYHSFGHFVPQMKFFEHCDFALDFKRVDTQLSSLLSGFDIPNFTIGNHFGGKKQDKKRQGVAYRYLRKEHLSQTSLDILNVVYKDDFDLYETVASSPDYLRRDTGFDEPLCR